MLLLKDHHKCGKYSTGHDEHIPSFHLDTTPRPGWQIGATLRVLGFWFCYLTSWLSFLVSWWHTSGQLYDPSYIWIMYKNTGQDWDEERANCDLTRSWHLLTNLLCWVCLFNQLCVNHPTLCHPAHIPLHLFMGKANLALLNILSTFVLWDSWCRLPEYVRYQGGQGAPPVFLLLTPMLSRWETLSEPWMARSFSHTTQSVHLLSYQSVCLFWPHNMFLFLII